MIPSPASAITKAGSKQTYYTLRFLVDRERIHYAYRAYAYFRWVDDILDEDSGSGLLLSEGEASDRREFLERQKSLLESCYRGEVPRDTTFQEKMLVELIQSDGEKDSGLQVYLRNMMRVLDFDSKRRGRLTSQVELNEYTRWLAVAVTEAMHYFIGHSDYAPTDETRYLAVSAAHITHLLRDTLEDIQAGYFNIPSEFLTAKGIGPQDVESEAYREWVQERAKKARACFKSGKAYLAQVKNIRCRIAGYAYVSSFEGVLEAIERLDFRLAPESIHYKGLRAGMKMSGSVLALTFFSPTRK